MPVHYFHLRDGKDVLLDPDGCDIAVDAVIPRALYEARSLISQDALTGAIDLSHRIEVENAHGRVVHSIAFADAVSITGAR